MIIQIYEGVKCVMSLRCVPDSSGKGLLPSSQRSVCTICVFINKKHVKTCGGGGKPIGWPTHFKKWVGNRSPGSPAPRPPPSTPPPPPSLTLPGVVLTLSSDVNDASVDTVSSLKSQYLMRLSTGSRHHVTQRMTSPPPPVVMAMALWLQPTFSEPSR